MVYGRTAKADVWWRVRPPGIDREWLESAVYAVLADGRQLQGSPRFLISVRPGARLVGVACQAAELSASMHSDGTREMYCFVGWLSAADAGGPELPDLYECYPRWAGDVYERYLRPVWNAPVSQVRRPDPGRAVPPPWPVTAPPPVDRHVVLQPVIHLDDWDIVWNHALAGPAPARVVLGWRTAGPAGQSARKGVTHLGVLDPDVPRLDRGGPSHERERARGGGGVPHPSLDAPAPPRTDAGPPHTDAGPPRMGAGPPRADGAPPRTGAAPPRRTGALSSRALPVLIGGSGVLLVLIAGAVVVRAFDGAAPAPSPAPSLHSSAPLLHSTAPSPLTPAPSPLTPAASPLTPAATGKTPPASPPSGTLVVVKSLGLRPSGRKVVPGFETGRGPWLRYGPGKGVTLEFAPQPPVMLGRADTAAGCEKDAGYQPPPADLPHVPVGVASVTCVSVPGTPDRLAAIQVMEQAQDSARVTVQVWEFAKETD